jgi:hypothetical protein
MACSRNEVKGGWRKMNAEKHHNLYCSPNIMWMIKLRRNGQGVHVVCMRETRSAQTLLEGKPEKDTWT